MKSAGQLDLFAGPFDLLGDLWAKKLQERGELLNPRGLTVQEVSLRLHGWGNRELQMSDENPYLTREERRLATLDGAPLRGCLADGGTSVFHVCLTEVMWLVSQWYHWPFWQLACSYSALRREHGEFMDFVFEQFGMLPIPIVWPRGETEPTAQAWLDYWNGWERYYHVPDRYPCLSQDRPLWMMVELIEQGERGIGPADDPLMEALEMIGDRYAMQWGEVSKQIAPTFSERFTGRGAAFLLDWGQWEYVAHLFGAMRRRGFDQFPKIVFPEWVADTIEPRRKGDEVQYGMAEAQDNKLRWTRARFIPSDVYFRVGVHFPPKLVSFGIDPKTHEFTLFPT